jgi:putative spermidine/putrescine transport system ATP-binding protein
MTIGENIMFPLKAQHWKGNRKSRVGDMLDLVKLTGFENRRASTLSGGQLQRVALARALAPNPQVLLLDEPLSALDKQLKENMQGELKAIQREVGVTTISVTHDQAEALAMSDQVIVMNNGRIEQAGGPHELYSAPINEFLARFLGEVNLVPIDAEGWASPIFPFRFAERGSLALARPEDFAVVDGQGSADGSFAATVRQVQFQGSSCRVELELAGIDEHLIVRLPYEGFARFPVAGEGMRLRYSRPSAHVVTPSDSSFDGTSASTTAIGVAEGQRTSSHTAA